jgi:hypothetical protein
LETEDLLYYSSIPTIKLLEVVYSKVFSKELRKRVLVSKVVLDEAIVYLRVIPDYPKS